MPDYTLRRSPNFVYGVQPEGLPVIVCFNEDFAAQVVRTFTGQIMTVSDWEIVNIMNNHTIERVPEGTAEVVITRHNLEDATALVKEAADGLRRLHNELDYLFTGAAIANQALSGIDALTKDAVEAGEHYREVSILLTLILSKVQSYYGKV